MNTVEQIERNKVARKEIAQIVKSNGLKWGFIADKLGIHFSNLSHWKSEKYLFGEDRLKMIETIINNYQKLKEVL